MKKIMHWFMDKIFGKKGTSGALLLLDLWSIGNYHPITGSLLVLHICLKVKLTYFMTVSALVLKFWITIPGSPT